MPSPLPAITPGRHAAIVGATASGKSALALRLAAHHPAAESHGGGAWEIVSADSMQVYRGMDVGTASPSAADRAAVAHHLIDIAEPGDEFDVATFQRLAFTAIESIEARGNRALLVGGTGLYVNAVVDGLELPGQFPDVRAQLETDSDTAAMHRRLQMLDPAAAARMAPTNRRRVVRALEVTVGSGRPFSSFGPGIDAHPPTPFRLLGVGWARDALDERIDRRLDSQLEDGFLDEVRNLVDGPRWSRSASQALGYAELAEVVRGALALDDAVEEIRRRTRRFSRRQEKWFRRDPRIQWLRGVEGADALAEHAHALLHRQCGWGPHVDA